MEAQLGFLVCKIAEAGESAGIDVNRLKMLLISSFPSEKEEIKNAESIFEVLLAIRIKHCLDSYDSIEAFRSVVRHFNLSDALTAIREYEEVTIITYMLLYLFCSLDLILRSTQTCFKYY